jgi:hypothetical protein
MRVTHRVIIAVPVTSKLAAGLVYAAKTKKSADNNSFTAGFFDGQYNEWAVACWGVDSKGQLDFDTLLAAYPVAKVIMWADEDATPEDQLAGLGLSRPLVDMGGK